MTVLIIFSLIFLGVLTAQYRPRPPEPDEDTDSMRKACVIITMVIGLWLAINAFAPLAALYLLVIGGFFPLASRLNFRRRTYLAVCLLAGAAIYSFPFREALQLRADTIVAKAEFPLESIESRLDYEPTDPNRSTYAAEQQAARSQGHFRSISRNNLIERPLVAPKPDDSSDLVLMSLSAESQLVEWASFQPWRYSVHPRSLALFMVHEQAERRFEALMGAGFMRMIWMYDWKDHLIELPPPQDLYLPDEYTPTDQFTEALTWAAEVMAVLTPGKKVTPEMQAHIRSYLDFVNLEGWGYPRSREEVAGFQSHHFRHRPIVFDTESEKLDDWRIVRLQLVSLLKHDTPRVYLDPELPNMEKLSSENAPTRELDEFERRALKHLQQDTDVVLKESENSLQMLGSLRAIENCRDCHRVQKGDLLGAFSYELRRAPHAVSLSE